MPGLVCGVKLWKTSHSHDASMGLVYFPYISHKNQPNVPKYTSPMDGMGFFSSFGGLDPHNFSFMFFVVVMCFCINFKNPQDLWVKRHNRPTTKFLQVKCCSWPCPLHKKRLMTVYTLKLPWHSMVKTNILVSRIFFFSKGHFWIWNYSPDFSRMAFFGKISLKKHIVDGNKYHLTNPSTLYLKHPPGN